LHVKLLSKLQEILMTPDYLQVEMSGLGDVYFWEGSPTFANVSAAFAAGAQAETAGENRRRNGGLCYLGIRGASQLGLTSNGADTGASELATDAAERRRLLTCAAALPGSRWLSNELPSPMKEFPCGQFTN
jgi:hypothetical protein